MPGWKTQSVARLTQESEVPSSIPSSAHTFISPSADSRRAAVSYWRKYVHLVLVNRLDGLSLPRYGVDTFTDHPAMITASVDVKQQNNNNIDVIVVVLLFYVHGKHLRSCRDGQLT